MCKEYHCNYCGERYGLVECDSYFIQRGYCTKRIKSYDFICDNCLTAKRRANLAVDNSKRTLERKPARICLATLPLR